MTTIFQYCVVRFTPNLVRDESVNVGIIVRDLDCQCFSYRFLPRAATVRKLAPDADRYLVHNFERQLASLRKQGQLFATASLGQIGHPTDPTFFDRAREEFNGNLQLSQPRGILAESLELAVNRVFQTYVAEPEGSHRPINYQAIAPYLMRERLWTAFERLQLLRPGLVQREVVITGKHAPWTFDLAFKNGDLNVISSLALNAPSFEANVGRALVFKGMLDDVRPTQSIPIHGTAVVQERGKTLGAEEAKGILLDADFQLVDMSKVSEFAETVQTALTVAQV